MTEFTQDTVITLGERTSQLSGSVTYEPMRLSIADKPLQEATGDSKHILIIGGGVSGLLVAWMLLDKGMRVTILAREWAWTKDFKGSRITSQIAGALWEMPPGGCGVQELEEPGEGWANLDHYREWALDSYDFYSNLAKISDPHEGGGRSFGLKMADLHQFFYDNVVDDPKDEKSPIYEHYQKFCAVKNQILQKYVKGDELMHNNSPEYIYKDKAAIETKFGSSLVNLSLGGKEFRSAYSHPTPIINTDKALVYLMALVENKGATLETREIKDIYGTGEELLRDFKADAIVNATGLGAKTLLNDQDVYPVRGAIRRVENTRNGKFRQLNDAYLVPAQIGPAKLPTKTVFIVPRNDDILYVGSIIQPNNSQLNLDPESPEVKQMWNRAGDFMQTLHHAAFRKDFSFAQGLRPFTKKNVKVRADDKVNFPLVHNYGHGGSGWTLGIGTARSAVYILERLLEETGETKEKAARINKNLYGAFPKLDLDTGATRHLSPIHEKAKL
ncbi:D-amino acid oxidase [Paecilomyces variotii No. 5]|uniref:D-amino acid oxidase n=1 Tax=Byssochlamys spectabilis (strain No. 5 / NBRC 109023) TaxID=1356009 RepID=V5GCM5_BYSSN|nr:D-amino acid oxidase [Paecilomyces variotii No. 5]